MDCTSFIISTCFVQVSYRPRGFGCLLSQWQWCIHPQPGPPLQPPPPPHNNNPFKHRPGRGGGEGARGRARDAVTGTANCGQHHCAPPWQHQIG